MLVDNGIKTTGASICIFRHGERDIGMMVHGGNFVSAGSQEHLQWARTILEAKFDIRTMVVGHEDACERQADILNSIIQAIDEGFMHKADARHS